MVRRGKKAGKRHGKSHEAEYRPSLSDFKTKKLLGKGGFGAVYLARKIRGPRCSTEMKKVELDILQSMSGQAYFPALHWSFEEEDTQYLVMDHVKGGDMFELLSAKQRMRVPEVKFYAAELLAAVDNLHKHGIVHQDIKLENVMVDEEGHLCLAADLDLRSVGFMLFEMWAGESPFDPAQTPQKMEMKFPPETPDSLISLLTGLLSPDPASRLTMEQAKQHEFFQGLDWMQVEQRGMSPPRC
ncbi:hypothetical protein BaRGS_00006956 [Batillaria attramentaria]|uniref:Protein kinase domain-containing protein n=1 Tax=Batillaria attramentaria TaxID=370345 RepID=A0ABD0LRH2_9CAEN